MGKTEALFAILGKMLTDGPRMPALYVGPTENQVRAVSKQRINQMIDTTPALQALHQKGRYEAVAEKFFAGSIRVGFAHAGSATALRSHPCGLVLVDEVSAMSDLPGEGSPEWLAWARTKTFDKRKMGIFSTPTVDGACKAWQWWLEGTREAWSWQCLHCNEWFLARLENFTWQGDTPLEARMSAAVHCPHCGGVHLNADKTRIPTAYKFWDVDEDGVFHPAEPRQGPIRSFYAPGLTCLFGGSSMGELADSYVRALAQGAAETQSVVNTLFGQPYRVTGDAPDWRDVKLHELPYARGDVPRNTQILACGVDVQANSIYYAIRGYGYEGASWGVQHGQILGDTSKETVWTRLDQVLNAKYGKQNLDITFIDSGYRSAKVYEFCRRRAKVFAAKGRQIMDKAVNSVLVDVRRTGKTIKTGLRLWHVNTHHMKSWIYDHIQLDAGTPHAFFQHHDTDDDYCKQVTAEVLTVERQKYKWIQVRKDNHYLDCEVMALGAAYTLNLESLKPYRAEAPKRKVHNVEGFQPRQL